MEPTFPMPAHIRHRTPADLGFAQPPEWFPHAATWAAWPFDDDEWRGMLLSARREFEALVRAMARHEPVGLLVADDEAETDARARLSDVDTVAFLRAPLDDVWLRDSGPIFVRRADGVVSFVHWGFNAWGQKFDWHLDDEVPEALAAHLGVDHFDVDIEVIDAQVRRQGLWHLVIEVPVELLPPGVEAPVNEGDHAISPTHEDGAAVAQPDVVEGRSQERDGVDVAQAGAGIRLGLIVGHEQPHRLVARHGANQRFELTARREEHAPPFVVVEGPRSPGGGVGKPLGGLGEAQVGGGSVADVGGHGEGWFHLGGRPPSTEPLRGPDRAADAERPTFPPDPGTTGLLSASDLRERVRRAAAGRSRQTGSVSRHSSGGW